MPFIRQTSNSFPVATNAIDIKTVIKSILLFVDETVAIPKAEILFDGDSILYCDESEV